jgi:hypothetical protein
MSNENTNLLEVISTELMTERSTMASAFAMRRARGSSTSMNGRTRFDCGGHGQDIPVLHGRVGVDDDHPATQDRPPYLEKYGLTAERTFGSIAKFSHSYSIALRVTITGVRGCYERG